MNPPEGSTPQLNLGQAALDVAIDFIDCINRGDVDGLGRLMIEDHQLRVFQEDPLSGRDANIAAWRGYATAFPTYLIHPHRLTVAGRRVAILGHTTGSHLGLTDGEEGRLTLIWIAELREDRIAVWQLVEDTPEQRRALGLNG